MLKMNKRQGRRVHALVQKRCANCLDHGEEHTLRTAPQPVWDHLQLFPAGRASV